MSASRLPCARRKMNRRALDCRREHQGPIPRTRYRLTGDKQRRPNKQQQRAGGRRACDSLCNCATSMKIGMSCAKSTKTPSTLSPPRSTREACTTASRRIPTLVEEVDKAHEAVERDGDRQRGLRRRLRELRRPKVPASSAAVPPITRATEWIERRGLPHACSSGRLMGSVPCGFRVESLDNEGVSD